MSELGLILTHQNSAYGFQIDNFGRCSDLRASSTKIIISLYLSGLNV